MPVDLDALEELLVMANQKPEHFPQFKAKVKIVKALPSLIAEVRELRNKLELITKPHRGKQ